MTAAGARPKRAAASAATRRRTSAPRESRVAAPAEQPLPDSAAEPRAIGAPLGAGEPDPPVRIPPGHHLNTGLADYDMWVRIFADVVPPKTPAGPRGRVWA